MAKPIRRGRDGDAYRDAYRMQAAMLIGMRIGRGRDAQGAPIGREMNDCNDADRRAYKKGEGYL